jgi:hypothetical protein
MSDIQKPREILTLPREWAFGILVLVAWVGLMGHLLVTQVMPQRSEVNLLTQARDPKELTQSWQDLEETLVIRSGRQQVGRAFISVIRDFQGRGFRADLRLVLGLNLLGRQRDISIRGAAELDDQFQLVRFSGAFDAHPVSLRVTGLISGMDLYVAVSDGTTSEPYRRRIVLDRPISLMDAVTPVATRAIQIRPGAEYALPVVDPFWSLDFGTMSMRVREPEQITLGHESVLAYPVDLALRDFRTRIWVDETGKVLRRRLIGSYTLDAAPHLRSDNLPEELKNPVVIPNLSASDFVGVEPNSLRGLVPQRANQSPLSILQALTP